MSERVAVVVPYYQRQPGLLARALRSVFGQRGAVQPYVIVVDDSSPAPAEPEIESLDPAWRGAVRLIRQPNGGAGVARNSGLDAVPDEIRYVALLDPDDVWMPDHLDRAIAALGSGHDFYFADVRREGVADSHFTNCRLVPSEHVPLGSGAGLYAFSGDFFDRSLRHSPVSTSSVVWRRARLGHLRFSTVIRPVGEDLLFWLDAARTTRRIAFGDRTAAVYGEGISSSWTTDWATAKALVIINAYGQYYDLVRSEFSLTAEEASFVSSQIRLFQVHFANTLFGMVRRRRWPNLGLVGAYLVRNPRTLMVAPMILATRFADLGA